MFLVNIFLVTPIALPFIVLILAILSPLQEIAPYNGFGSLEDSLQSCLSLVPQPPKKDFIKMLENGGKVLRFEAVMVWFIIDYDGKKLFRIS